MAQNFKKENRKEQIKKAAIKLMSEHGYKDISVQKIIDEINYSKGGFYHCYESKEELFKEILIDGMRQRFQEVKSLKENTDNLNKQDLLIEVLLRKILDQNTYKKLFATFMIEISDDKELRDFYDKGLADTMPEFFEFWDSQGMSDFKAVFDDEFNIFISTLMVGTEIFNLSDNEKYRKRLKEILTAYFEKKTMFN